MPDTPRPQLTAKQINFQRNNASVKGRNFQKRVREGLDYVHLTTSGTLLQSSFLTLLRLMTPIYDNYWGDKSNEDVMGWACGTYGEICIQDFALQTSRNEF